MSLDARLRRLEGEVHPEEAAIEAVRQWTHTLELDDLRCFVSLSDDPSIRTRPPDGMTLEDVRGRARAVLQSAPDHIRGLFADSDWMQS
jgi:hypothetical protein